MKLTYLQFETHLAKNLAPIYIISGDELLLKHDALTLLRKTAKQAGFSERMRITPDAGFDWNQLYTELYSPSLLAEKRVIELDCRDSTLNKTAGAILQEYAERPSSDNVLVIDIAKIDDKIAKSAWYKALEKIGIVVAIWPITRDQLPQWIINRAKKYKLMMQQDAANLLADFVEGNLVAAAQAIEKIYLLKTQAPIDINIVQTVLTDESRFNIFDFLESLIGGDKTRSLHMLANLKEDGTEPVLILWGITRELRLLADLAAKIKNGAAYQDLFQQYRIFARRQLALKRFLTRFSANDCFQFLAHSAHIDRMIKGGISGNVWEQLELFCLRLR